MGSAIARPRIGPATDGDQSTHRRAVRVFARGIGAVEVGDSLARTARLAVWGRQCCRSPSKAKGDFLSNMSHEIRTPMMAILGYSERLLDDNISDEEREVGINTIWRNGNHLLSLISEHPVAIRRLAVAR
ncbi:hypothetical protein N8467_00035 [bacterium]|nr:hypothetical protein [bacterium]